MRLLPLTTVFLLTCLTLSAQRSHRGGGGGKGGRGGGGGGARPSDLGAMDQPIGASGIAWYTTWDTAKAEAKRSNRPIFFFAAAAQCGNTPGVF